MMLIMLRKSKLDIELFPTSRSGDKVNYPTVANSGSTFERLATMRSRGGKFFPWKSGFGC